MTLEIAEQWASLVASLIAIGTFVTSRRAVIGWATSIRRELEAARFARFGESPAPDIRQTHKNIVLQRPVEQNRWAIKWTRGDGSEPEGVVAAITSPRLRWHLARNPAVRDLPVMGEIRFLDAGGGPAMVEVPSIDHIQRGGMPGWLGRILFG